MGHLIGTARRSAGTAQGISTRLRGVMYGKPAADSLEDSPTTRLAHFLGHR